MEVYLGTILSFAFDFAPKGWASCTGALLGIQTNQALFSLLGTTYGGNGVSTFALPNLQGRTLLGTGVSNPMGEILGTPSVTMTVANMPTHTHPSVTASTISVPAYSDTGNTTNPSGNVLSVTNGINIYANVASDPSKAPDGTMAPSNATTTVGTMGGSQPFSTMSPYLVMNYSIALVGFFPSRD